MVNIKQLKDTIKNWYNKSGGDEAHETVKRNPNFLYADRKGRVVKINEAFVWRQDETKHN